MPARPRRPLQLFTRRWPLVASLCVGGLLVLLLGIASHGAAQVPPAPAPPSDAAQKEYLKVLARDAKDQTDAKRLKAWEALLTLGDTGASILKPIVEVKLGRDRVALEEQLKGQELARLRKKFEEALVERRKAAIACIFDPKRYPDENHGAVGQPEVDRLVQRVREAWERPAVFARQLEPKLEQLAALLEEDVVYAESVGLALPADLQQVNDWLAAFTSRFERDAAGINGTQHDWNVAVTKWHAEEMATSADASERACMDATNTYRLMMGAGALEIDERLVRAARKHSKEMGELGYFAHDSPVAENASFGARCAREGYSGASGENIAGAGDGTGAFHGWYSSSGHHRNMLGGHRQFGVGRAGEFPGSLFTQNFGGSDSLRDRTIEDPQLEYLARRKKLDIASPDAHLVLAIWCKANGLAKQSNLHAETAVALDPGHVKALEFLGRARIKSP